MSCEHTKIIVIPRKIKKTFHGVQFKDMTDADVHCDICGLIIPSEDIIMYPKEHIYIGVPTELVD